MYLCGLANNMTEVAHSMLASTRDGYPSEALKKCKKSAFFFWIWYKKDTTSWLCL